MEKYLPYVGHVQVAQASAIIITCKSNIGETVLQVPARGEPDSPGELDYRYIFSCLQKGGYEGWVGLEYSPSTTTSEGLGFIQKMGLSF